MNKKIERVKHRVEEILKLNMKLNDDWKLNEVTEKVKDLIILPSSQYVKKKWRKVVTGDEQKRVRDHIKEKKEIPRYVKLFDKISFTIGVLNIPLCQFFILNRPDYFGIMFCIIIPTLLLGRYFYFKSIKLQYFLYDFCYFTNILSILCVFLHNYMPWFFRMLFIYTNGPLTWALIVWRNSLVYHDFDKMTSIYIHILPAMLTLVLRWNVISPASITPLSLQDFINAALGYIFWQVSYYIKTEIMDRHVLDNNPELLTSLRWLAKDKKNATARGVLKLMKSVGVMKKDEEYQAHEVKTKIIFMTSQFVFTVVAFLPSFLLYRSYRLHVGYMVALFVTAVYNGASYYIEVFSQRYQLKFSKKEDMQKVVQAAAEIAYQAATNKRQGGPVNTSPSSAQEMAPDVRSTSPQPGSVEGEYGQTQAFEGDHCTTPLLDVKELQEKSETDTTPSTGDPPAVGDSSGFHQPNDNSVRGIIEAATTAFVDEWHNMEQSLYERGFESEDTASDYDAFYYSDRSRGNSDDFQLLESPMLTTETAYGSIPATLPVGLSSDDMGLTTKNKDV
mmetsp:Transcript_15296/g.23035  ORF Transcript_15296/g.23035 Transcript_15296/m.23035 type:complete len:560 (-) Transcript_15296:92-1771(-)